MVLSDEKTRGRLVDLLDSVLTGEDVTPSETIADFLIKNGVLAPPCKVGDDTWWISDEPKNGSRVRHCPNDIKAVCHFGGDNFQVITKDESEPEALHTIYCLLSEKEAYEFLDEIEKLEGGVC